MGMFDSLYDTHGNEWQTKALGRALDRFEVGDPVPFSIAACQIEVLGGRHLDASMDAFATIRKGILIAVPAERDPSLPLYDYSGDPKDDSEPSPPDAAESAAEELAALIEEAIPDDVPWWRFRYSEHVAESLLPWLAAHDAQVLRDAAAKIAASSGRQTRRTVELTLLAEADRIAGGNSA